MIERMNIILRLEQPSDYRAVEELTREAFWDRHVAGCDEHHLIHIMRDAAVHLLKTPSPEQKKWDTAQY